MGHLFNISINVQVLVAKTQQKNYVAVTHVKMWSHFNKLLYYYIYLLNHLFPQSVMDGKDNKDVILNWIHDQEDKGFWDDFFTGPIKVSSITFN